MGGRWEQSVTPPGRMLCPQQTVCRGAPDECVHSVIAVTERIRRAAPDLRCAYAWRGRSVLFSPVSYGLATLDDKVAKRGPKVAKNWCQGCQIRGQGCQISESFVNLRDLP